MSVTSVSTKSRNSKLNTSQQSMRKNSMQTGRHRKQHTDIDKDKGAVKIALSLDEDQAMFSLITVSDIRHLGGCVSFDLKGIQIQKVAIQTCNDLVI